MIILDWLTAFTGTPWVYVALGVLLLVDGFFPFVPGETFVVALSALAATANGPQAWIVLGVAFVGTLAGDFVAFQIGKRVGVSRWRWMRGRRMSAAIGWARTGLGRRPTSFFLTAKFVPFVRVATTMTAGAIGYPLRSYLGFSVLASFAYTGYHVVIGYVAGSFLAANPLLATVASIGCAFVVGIVIDRLGRIRAKRQQRRAIVSA